MGELFGKVRVACGVSVGHVRRTGVCAPHMTPLCDAYTREVVPETGPTSAKVKVHGSKKGKG
jgi:hypothetical protein